jgi:hypothetical protein
LTLSFVKAHISTLESIFSDLLVFQNLLFQMQLVPLHLGDEHSSGHVRDLPQTRGHGPVEGRVVLGRSPPERNDQAYYYLYGDIRKYPGDFAAAADDVFTAGAGGGDDFSTFGPRPSNATTSAASASTAPGGGDSGGGGGGGVGSKTTRPLLMFQGEKGAPGNYDLEACGDLVNPEEVRGNVCMVARGSCYFSAKTLACQRAGAIAAIIVNTDLDEGAADNWVSSHEPEGIRIPTVSYGGAQANQMLREMYDAAAAGAAATGAAFTAAAAALAANATATTTAATAATAAAAANTTAADATAAVNDTGSWFYTRPVAVKIYSYECRAPAHCPACGPGLLSPEDNCTSAACPGGAVNLSSVDP